MINRDIVEQVHERMNNEVVAAEASTTDSDSKIPCVNPRAEDIPGNWYRIAQDQSSKLYLPQFLNEPQNAVDPAFKVCTGM